MNHVHRTFRNSAIKLAARLATSRPDLMEPPSSADAAPPLRRLVVTLLATFGRS